MANEEYDQLARVALGGAQAAEALLTALLRDQWLSDPVAFEVRQWLSKPREIFPGPSLPMMEAEGYGGYATDDPKHPDYHSIRADLWDNREKGA